MTSATPKFTAMCVLLALLLTVPWAHAQETLWTTNPDLPTPFSNFPMGPSARTPITDREIADDFNVIGVVERILADGMDCQGCYANQPVTGVYVRFYAWTISGPGELQSEQFLTADDPRFVWTPGSGPAFLDITLPDPFHATGWHFVSVQVTFSAENSGTGKWYFVPVNSNATMGIAAFFRDNNAGGAWIPWHTTQGFPPLDASFALIGTPGTPTTMTILSATSHPITPSCRLRINGDGFGIAQGSGQVFISTAPAIVTQWTETVIIAYVPEPTGIGRATVRVLTDEGEEDTFEIDVLPREGDGRVKWRFAVDADFMNHRPGVGPDGSIYLNDYNHGRLYRLNPDGGLVWIVDALRGQIGLGGEGPVVVGDDGTIYVGVNPLGPTTELVAFNPDGSVRWDFIEPDSIGIAVGPAIGPDGNIYVTFHDADHDSFGLTSFTPDGTLRWNNSGLPALYEHGGLGAELVFGASMAGGAIDQVVLTVDRNDDPYLYAFDMRSGEQIWAVQRGVTQFPFLQPQIQPEAGADGKVYMTEFVGSGGLGWALWAFDGATGDRLWYYDPGILAGASGPELGSDGVIYFSWDISRVGAVTGEGEALWTHVDLSGVQTQPTVTDDNRVVLVGGGGYGESGTFKALDARTGEQLWKVQLSDEDGSIVPDERPIVTHDSTTAYWPTLIIGDSQQFEYCYLYATTVGEATRVGDISGDGHVNLQDLLLLLAAWGECPKAGRSGPADACAADLNGDASVDLQDMLILLAHWE